MTADNRIVQLGVSVDTTEAEQGFAKIGAGSRNMAQQVSQAGQQAAHGIDAIGTAAEGPAGKVDKATRSIVASIQRATAAAESAGKSGSAFYESLANQRGANLDVLKPYLAQLDAVTQKQMDAKIAMAQGTAGLNEMGMSAKATAAAMRGVPAQFTDIITSLQGGQQPMTVLLQQGGQLKDMFGGIGNASKALGGYVVGLINPMTLLAAGVGAVGYAYYKGSQETDAYNKALILSGNIAGTTSGQMSAMAANIAKTTGTQIAAAAALAEMAQSSGVGRDNLEAFTRAAIKFESATGAAVSETVKQFNELAKSPLDASLKLNDTYNYLTASVYRQIKALDEQGKTTEAANLAQKAFADTLDSRSAQMIGNLGYIEQGWNAIKKAVMGAGSAIAGIGRDASPADQAASLRKQLEDRQQNGPTNELSRGSWEKGNQALKEQLSYLQEQERQLRKGADLRAAEATQVKALAEWDKTGVKFLSDKVKMEQDINAAKNLGIAAGESQAKIEARIKDIRESYAKKGGAKSKEGDPFAADREYAKEYAKAWEDFTKIGAEAAGKTDDLSKAQARLVDYLKSPAYANHNAAMRETVLQSAYAAIASEQLAAEKKKEAAAMKESADAAFANSEAIYKSMVATEDKLRAQLQENETMGMTAVQIAQLVKARDLEAAAALDAKAALYEQAGARDEDIDGIKRTADALRKLADARLDSAVKKQEQADWMSFFTSIDNAAHQVWSNVLQGGQDIWSKLKNTAKTIFFDWLYQMTLKKWIFSIGATITGSGAQGGSNILQMGQQAYSAYNSGSSLYGVGSAYASGTMSGANAAGSLFANATGTGIDGLLLTNGAYGTAAGAGTAGTAGAAGAAGAEAGAGAGAAGIGAGATLGLAALAYLAYTDWNDDSHKTIRNGGGYKADKNGNIVLDQGTGIGPSTAKPIYDQEGMLTGNYAPDGNLFGGRLLDANGSDVLATRSAASIAYGNTLLGRFGSKATFNDFSGGAASSNVGEGIAYAGATVNGKKIGVSDALDKLAQRGSMTDAQTVDEYTRLLEVLNIGGLQAAKLAGPMGDYLDKLGDVSTMTKATADATLVMINTYADFQDVFKNSPFDNLKTASVEASAQLVKVAGDIGTLAGVTANYYDLFATDAEKQAHALGLAKDAFSAINVVMPASNANLREWYKSEVARLGAMDLSVEANAKAYAGALKLASGVDALAKAEEQAATTRQSWQDQLNVLTGKTTDTALQMQHDLASTTDESTQALIRAVYAEKDRQKAMAESATAMQKLATDQAAAAQKSADAYKSALSAQQSYYASLTSAGDAVRNLLAGLKTGVNAGTSPQSRLEAARAQYLQDLSAARGGDFAAYNRVATTAQTYIGAGSDMYASGSEQKAILAQVQSELQNLPAVSQYDANLAQLKAIEDAIKSNTTSTNGAIGTLNTETLAAIASMTGTLSNNFASIDINNNGVLTFDELKAGLNISEELTRQLIASVDLNGDGQISQLEVIKANTANTTASLDAQKIDTLAAITSMTATLSSSFGSIDANANGMLTFDELKTALGTGDTLTQQLINAIDTNGDGQISKLEIIAANTFGLDTLARINASVNSINWTDKAAAVAQFTPLAQANGWTLQQIAAATGYNLSDIQALFSGSPLATGMNAKGFSSTSKTGSTAAAPIGISSGPTDAAWAGGSSGISASRTESILGAVNNLDWNDKNGAATDIWNKAYYLGWSEQDIATATGYNLSDIDALFKNAGLPAFASGGSHMGGLRIVGENGPELEATGPSRIWNAADTANMLRGGGDNQALITEVRELRKEVAKAKESDTPIHVTVMTHDGKKLAEQVISTIKERSRNREVVIYANGVGAAAR